MLFSRDPAFMMGAACAMTARPLHDPDRRGSHAERSGNRFVAAAMRWTDMNGQIMALFVMTAAAANRRWPWHSSCASSAGPVHQHRSFSLLKDDVKPVLFLLISFPFWGL